MWDVKACRSCLTVKGKLVKIGESSKRQYSAIVGLQFSDGDGYPAYFCVECHHHIRKSLAFRRKSRRAHFVLKEIMAVRKQVSYSDIVTVNRKKTNLESSLNFWEPHNSHCYLLANEEGQDDDLLQKYDLDHHQYARTRSKHIVDIKPEIETDVPEKTNETENAEQEFDTNNDVEDIPTNDYLEPDIDTANIDMNDIFKDLKTEEPESDTETIEPKLEIKETEDSLSKKTCSNAFLTKALVMFDLRVLNLDEQKEIFKLRLSLPSFVLQKFRCSMCLTVYKTMEELVQHVQFHNERKGIMTHACQVCKNNFPTEKDLNIHVSSCHLYEYACRKCHAKVYTQKDAVSHFRSKHSTESYDAHKQVEVKKHLRRGLTNFTITPLSQQMMVDVMLLRSRQEHEPKTEPGEMKLPVATLSCDICSAGFQTRRNLEKHMVLKHRYMYTCKLCKEVCTTRDQALEHDDVAHKKTHYCTECGKTFKKSHHLEAHMKYRHVDYTPCNLCGSSFRTTRCHYQHQLREHGYISLNDPLVGDPQHKCSDCGVQFFDRRSLEWHLVNMNHAGADMVQFACVTCKKIYQTEEELETHFITCRGGSNKKYPRKCCYCSEMLSKPLEYKMHYFNAHPDLQYRYVSQNSICDICGKSIFKPMLEAHIRTHATGVACRLCAAVHGTAAAHVAHVLAQHARRPFRCALCTRRFKFRSDCKDHILRIHAPTKLFKCEFCGVEFSYWKNLKEHSQTVHNLVIPQIKTKVFKSKHKIFVYAHMKIIINELERDNVEKLQVELIDYLEQKSKPVDYQNYFIFSPDAEESVCLKVRKKKKKKKATELETAVAQITFPEEGGLKIEKIEILKPADDFDQTQYDLEIAKEDYMEEGGEQTEDHQQECMGETENGEDNKMQLEEVMEEIENGEDIYQIRMQQPLEEVKCGEVIEKLANVEKEEYVEEMEGVEDGAMPLEVIENGGHQYVMINGELYRIACEDEV